VVRSVNLETHRHTVEDDGADDDGSSMELRSPFHEKIRLLFFGVCPRYLRFSLLPFNFLFSPLLCYITIDDLSPQRVYECLLQWCKEGKFTGGLGFYPEPIWEGGKRELSPQA
jgi:hypothetical protein